ncbi:Crp/Fnr family transcriptional regulator [Solibacillus sp. FSL K6-1523]|uniref:Crp/Fnr family transcriptional regulator n=1 Tax=Solibacillus sp. FSL K6-1523 TaxID=2921471 RepID=UPI0030FA2274
MNLKSFRLIYDYTFTEEIIHEITMRSYLPNEYILKAGEELDGLYFLIEGRYFVSSLEITGKELLLRYCQKPAIMGDIELFEGCFIQSNCIAAEKCDFIFISRFVYEKYLKYDSDFNQLLLKELAYKLRTCTISSRVNALSPASVRLAAYLCTIESTSHFNNYIRTNTLDDVASLIGTTKRHLNRILKEWSDAAIIERTNEEIQILHWEKIKEISESVRFE